MVWDILGTEVLAGRMAGPFPEPPFPLRVHPLGLVEKNEPNSFRPIYDLSVKDKSGLSVNSCTPDKFKKVQYCHFEYMLSRLAVMPDNVLLSKHDVKHAFRNIRISRKNFALTGIYFKGAWFIDLVLPFGASTSPFTWEKFANFLNWVINYRSGFDSCWHFLDDFLSAGVLHDITHINNTFREVTAEFGVPLSEKKHVPPCEGLELLGHWVSMKERFETCVSRAIIICIFSILFYTMQNFTHCVFKNWCFILSSYLILLLNFRLVNC